MWRSQPILNGLHARAVNKMCPCPCRWVCIMFLILSFLAPCSFSHAQENHIRPQLFLFRHGRGKESLSKGSRQVGGENQLPCWKPRNAASSSRVSASTILCQLEIFGYIFLSFHPGIPEKSLLYNKSTPSFCCVRFSNLLESKQCVGAERNTLPLLDFNLRYFQYTYHRQCLMPNIEIVHISGKCSIYCCSIYCWPASFLCGKLLVATLRTWTVRVSRRRRWHWHCDICVFLLGWKLTWKYLLSGNAPFILVLFYEKAI